MFEIVEFLLNNRTWSPTCLRTNIAKPEDFYVGPTGFKRVHLLSNLVGHTTHQDRLLRSALELIAPEWWGEETHITINKNVVCCPHVDKNNAEYSYIAFVGKFAGGALLFESNQRYEEPYKWYKIDAFNTLHWNEPITEGTKYSIIIFKTKRKCFLSKKKALDKKG